MKETRGEKTADIKSQANPIEKASILPGILLAVVIAVMATAIGKVYPVIGGAVTAIIIGFLARNFLGLPKKFELGLDYTIKKLLKVAIVLMGFGLSFATVVEISASSIIVVAVIVVLGLGLTYLVGRWFGLKGDLPILIGIGTSICGATAIATTAPILKAKEQDFVYAVNTIFAFNVLAVVSYPFIGQLLGFSDQIFGMWAGAAIHDTSSVVAAGYMYSDEAGAVAVIVKLLRTLTLIPLALLLAIFVSYKMKSQTTEQVKVSKIFPYFILVFVGVVLLNTFIPFPEVVANTTNQLAKFLIVMVMASVGLKASFKDIKTIGVKPFIVGLIASVIIGVVSISLIFALA